MKTYLFDSFNRYKRFSEELDAKTILCNKSWWVFNDSGEKELYIFNEDGSLIISVSGRVTNATWKYITANKSIIITGNNQSYMVHPAFYDYTIFALKVDGTNEFAFLIDENNLHTTNLRSFNDVVSYFTEKERQAVLAEEGKRQAAIKAEQERIIQEQQERLKQEIYRQEQEKEEKEDLERQRIFRIYDSIDNKAGQLLPWGWNISFCLTFFLMVGDENTFRDNFFDFLFEHLGGWGFLVGIIVLVLLLYFMANVPYVVYKWILVQIYKIKNPNDIDAIKYLEEHFW